MSQITTHIPNTSLGRPAAGVRVILQAETTGGWHTLAGGITNQDGRLPSLLPADEKLLPGYYSLLFEVAPYFEKNSIASFYPRVRIDFETGDQNLYHVPLLLNPWGYSTYRGFKSKLRDNRK